MAGPRPESDAVTRSQGRFVTQFRKGQRLLKWQYYFSLAFLGVSLAILTILILFVVEPSMYFILVVMYVPIITQVKQFKAMHACIQQGDAILRQLPPAGAESKEQFLPLLLYDLTDYLRQLFRVVRLAPVYEEEIEDEPPARVLQRIDRELGRKSRVAILLVLVGLVATGVLATLMLYRGVAPSTPETTALTILVSFIVAGAVLAVYLSMRWRFTIRSWIRVFQGIFEWGMALEETFGAAGAGDGSGDEGETGSGTGNEADTDRGRPTGAPGDPNERKDGEGQG